MLRTSGLETENTKYHEIQTEYFPRGANHSKATFSARHCPRVSQKKAMFCHGKIQGAENSHLLPFCVASSLPEECSVISHTEVTCL